MFAASSCSSTAAAAEDDSGDTSSNSSRRRPTRDDNSDHADEETVDFFRIFDLPHEFAIDEQVLRERYRNFMKDLHPDQQKQQQQQQQQQNDSPPTASGTDNKPSASAVTRAYDALKRPHVRATHLLKILGHPLEEEATTETTTQQQPQLVGACFLMDVMMHREEIDEARHDQKELKRLFDQNAVRMADCCRQLAESFASRDLPAARTGTAQLQYWNRIDETLREALDSLE
jgi:molecular chaperone HscB